MVVSLSALRTGHLYLQELHLVFFSVRVWVDPRAKVRPAGLCRLKNSSDTIRTAFVDSCVESIFDLCSNCVQKNYVFRYEHYCQVWGTAILFNILLYNKNKITFLYKVCDVLHKFGCLHLLSVIFDISIAKCLNILCIKIDMTQNVKRLLQHPPVLAFKKVKDCYLLP